MKPSLLALLMPMFAFALESTIRIPDFVVGGKSPLTKTVDLPALPARPGHVVVLQAKIYAEAPRAAGCNYCIAIQCNEAPLGRYAKSAERLLGREPVFHLKSHPDRHFPVFSGERLMTCFGPNAAAVNALCNEGNAADFTLRLDDVVRGVDGNTLLFINTRADRSNVWVRDCAVGYLPVAATAAVSKIPRRAALAGAPALAQGHLELRLAPNGGLQLLDKRSNRALCLESAVGMAADTPPALAATAEPVRALRSEVRDRRLVVRAELNGGLRLLRICELRGGLLRVTETWTNAGKQERGVPVRHRFFLQGHEEVLPRFRLGGNPDATELTSECQNPTLFLEADRPSPCAFGVAVESAWLRLLMSLRCASGVGELYTNQLALAPGQSITWTFTVDADTDGGYYAFLNRLRGRWGLNGRVTMLAPIFWGFAPRRAPGKDLAEKMRRAFGHLGKCYVTLDPWMGTIDVETIRSGKWPRLPGGAPRAPGRCPDFDAAAFTTFRHREPQWRLYAEEVRTLREAAPEAKALLMMHPAMFAVYKPCAEQWPYADSAIRTADGRPFESATYSRGWLNKFCDQDFGIYYYNALPGSLFWECQMAMVERALEEVGADGIYCDEFSWSFHHRGYSRYDYSRQDPYSADLDENGKVLRRKSDNAFTSVPFQRALIRKVHGAGRFLMTNGASGTPEVMEMAHQRFCEGGNGVGSMPQTHLNPVPMVLGNFGDQGTLQGLLQGVRTALSQGCIYSPFRCNLVLTERDNFICKLYPITILRMDEGIVVGRERLIASRSGTFEWPGCPDGPATLYLYGRDGLRIRTATAAQVQNGRITLSVPDGGLAIAEAPQPPSTPAP